MQQSKWLATMKLIFGNNNMDSPYFTSTYLSTAIDMVMDVSYIHIWPGSTQLIQLRCLAGGAQRLVFHDMCLLIYAYY